MTFLCFCVSVDHRVLTAQNVKADTAEEARDIARESWEDRLEAHGVEVWFNGEIVLETGVEGLVAQ